MNEQDWRTEVARLLEMASIATAVCEKAYRVIDEAPETPRVAELRIQVTRLVLALGLASPPSEGTDTGKQPLSLNKDAEVQDNLNPEGTDTPESAGGEG